MERIMWYIGGWCVSYFDVHHRILEEDDVFPSSKMNPCQVHLISNFTSLHTLYNRLGEHMRNGAIPYKPTATCPDVKS